MKLIKILPALLIFPLQVSAVTLVQTSDAGYYNDSIGTLLNLSNGSGSDDSTAYFPIFNDSAVNFATAPDLSTAGTELGDWLNTPGSLNANWTYETSIPSNWTVGTEVGIIYEFNTLGAINVSASFGVDNGIFAWLDGVYLGGVRQGGGVSLGEHVFNIGDLASGTHYLQLLLEDHGGSNGYDVLITADEFIPAPEAVPVPAAVWLFGSGLLGLVGVARSKNT